MFALALGFLVSSCGSKVDEALVAEYNAKKAEAEKLLIDAQAGKDKMHVDHDAWSAKLDEASKIAGVDTVKINGYKTEIANHNKMVGELDPTIDSLKSYIGAKTTTNEELKAGIAGLTTHIGALTSNWKTIMDAHTKLGADIMALVAPGVPAAEAPAAPVKPDVKKPTTSKGGAPKETVPVTPTPKAPTTSKGGAPKR
jgi:hypothetical protein